MDYARLRRMYPDEDLIALDNSLVDETGFLQIRLDIDGEEFVAMTLQSPHTNGNGVIVVPRRAKVFQ